MQWYAEEAAFIQAQTFYELLLWTFQAWQKLKVIKLPQTQSTRLFEEAKGN